MLIKKDDTANRNAAVDFTSKSSEKPALIANGYAYPSISREVLLQWLPALTVVSAFSYGFTESGELIGLDDEELIAAAAASPGGAVQSLMVLAPLNDEGAFSNQLAKELLESESAQAELIKNILINLQQKNMFGVDFDFEYVFPENRDQYTMLVAKATDILNARGYSVTVALAPKTSRDQKGLLYEGHDYHAMGLAANFVLLMSYEWGYTFGPPMAVAPIDQVRRVIEYGVSEIEPDKILMGMASYGYDWTLPYVRGTSRAEKLSNPEAVARAQRYGAEVMYDDTAQSPYYNYTDENELEHVVWFEDKRSWSAKFEIIKEFGLAGIGIWNITEPFPGGIATVEENFTVVKV